MKQRVLLALQFLLVGMCTNVNASDAESRDLVIEELRAEGGLHEQSALWVLAIGVSQYEDSSISLKYADHDAETIARLLRTQEGLLFAQVHTQVLVNEQATKREILREIDGFLGQASSGDVVVVFMAGHGMKDRKTDTYYFVPYNASLESLFYDGLAMPLFEEACKRIENRVDKLVLLMDTCHSGSLQVNARAVNPGEDLTEALSQAKGRYILSASEGGELSFEHEDFRFENETRGHGGFTYSLMRGMLGRAADERGVVWMSRLFGHVNRDVPLLTRAKQHPHSQILGSDLPLFVVAETGMGGLGGEEVVPIDQILLPKLQEPRGFLYYSAVGFLAQEKRATASIYGKYWPRKSRKTFLGFSTCVSALSDGSGILEIRDGESKEIPPSMLLSCYLSAIRFFQSTRDGLLIKADLGPVVGWRSYTAQISRSQEWPAAMSQALEGTPLSGIPIPSPPILEDKHSLVLGARGSMGVGVGLPVGRSKTLMLNFSYVFHTTMSNSPEFRIADYPEDGAVDLGSLPPALVEALRGQDSEEMEESPYAYRGFDRDGNAKVKLSGSPDPQLTFSIGLLF